MALTVYVITNVRTEHVYIGSTLKSLNKRFKEHCHRSPKSAFGICSWYPDIDPDDLTIKPLSIVENPSDDELKYRRTESEWILKYRQAGHKLYNKRFDAIHHSEESKQKMSDSLKGRITNPESVEKFIEWSRSGASLGNTNASHHEIIYKGVLYDGSTRLYRKLIEEGYDITYHQLNNYIGAGFVSKRNSVKYKDLFSQFNILK